MVDMNQPTMKRGAQTIKEGAKEMKEAVVTQSSRAFGQCYDSTESMIKNYPMRSMLVSFAVGFAAGALILAAVNAASD
jgi:hypothetical protein